MVYGIGFPELPVIYVIAALVLVGIVVAIVRAARGKKHWRNLHRPTHEEARPRQSGSRLSSFAMQQATASCETDARFRFARHQREKHQREKVAQAQVALYARARRPGSRWGSPPR